MKSNGTRKRIQVLTREDSQLWHSPFSHVLRDLRQDEIIARCREAVRLSGGAEFVIYDADEHALYRGAVTE